MRSVWQTKFFLILIAFLFLSPDVKGLETTSEVLKLTVTDAVKMALEQNIELKNEVLEVLLSESSFRVDRAQYLPQLTLSTNSEYHRPESSLVGTDATLNHHFSAEITQQFATTGGTLSLYSDVTRYDDRDADELSNIVNADGEFSNAMGIRLNQPLLKDAGPWSDRMTLRQSRLTRENAMARFELAKNRMILDVITMYFSALKQEKLVEVALRSVDNARMHLQNTQIKLEEGLVAQMDVSQAELQLARQQTSLIRAEQNVATLFDTLKLKLALPLEVKIDLVQTIDHSPETFAPDAAVSEALMNRREMAILKNDLLSAELGIEKAMNQRLPALNLVADAQHSRRDDRLGNTFQVDDESYNVSMGFSYTFGNRLPREQWRQSRIRLARLENDLDNRRRQIEKEVRDEIRNYQALLEALKVSAKALDIAEKNMELANHSYREGLTGNLDLIRAQDDLSNAGNSYYSDILDLAVARVRIKHVLGRDIDPDTLALQDEYADLTNTKNDFQEIDMSSLGTDAPSPETDPSSLETDPSLFESNTDFSETERALPESDRDLAVTGMDYAGSEDHSELREGVSR